MNESEIERTKGNTNEKQKNNSKKQNNKKSQIIYQVEKKSFCKKYKILFICMGAFILILITMVIIIVFVLLKKPVHPAPSDDPLVDSPIDPPVPPDTDPPIDPPVLPDIDPPVTPAIKKEFEILTKTGDLRKISVVQKSKEKTRLNNQTFTSEITRKTYYDIYFKSEEDASEDNKKYYS